MKQNMRKKIISLLIYKLTAYLKATKILRQNKKSKAEAKLRLRYFYKMNLYLSQKFRTNFDGKNHILFFTVLNYSKKFLTS